MKQSVIALFTILFAVSLASVGTYAAFSDTEVMEDNSLQMTSLDLQLADFDEDFSLSGDTIVQTWNYASLYPAGMAPGNSLEGSVYLRNVGSYKEGHLDIYCHIMDVELDNDTDAENRAENRILITEGGGIDNDGDGLIDEDPVDGTDNDGDGLIDEDPPPASGPIPVTAGRGVYNKDRVMIINYMKYQSASIIDVVWADGTSWDSRYMADMDGDGKITLHDFKKHGVTGLPPPVGGLASFSMKVTFGTASADLNQYQGDQTQMTLVFALFQ